MKMASRFADLHPITPDPAFSLVEAYAKDPAEKKVDLCPGFYQDENGRPWILPCVEKVSSSKNLNSSETLANRIQRPRSSSMRMSA